MALKHLHIPLTGLEALLTLCAVSPLPAVLGGADVTLGAVPVLGAHVPLAHGAEPGGDDTRSDTTTPRVTHTQINPENYKMIDSLSISCGSGEIRATCA